jgi:hypothetical protein
MEDVKGKISIGLIMVANLFMIGRCVTLYRKNGRALGPKSNVWKLYVFAGGYASSFIELKRKIIKNGNLN